MSISSRFINGPFGGPFGGPLGLAIAATLIATTPVVAQDQRGWLGVIVHCPQDDGCDREESGGVVIWSFDREPIIQWVSEDGPADRAGLRVDDVVIAIDGVAITSPVGGQRFAALQADVQVTFSVRRLGQLVRLRVTPGTHQEAFFNEWHQLLEHTDWAALIGRVKESRRQRQALEQRLRQAEQIVYQYQYVGRQAVSETDPRLLRLRVRIDSVRQEMLAAQSTLRIRTDSLAVRTLYLPKSRGPRYTVVPAVPAVSVPAVGTQTVAVIQTQYGSNAVAGARFEEMSEGLATAIFQGIQGGLLVLKVVEGTPAYVAGLREGDVVIAVNGAKVAAVDDLRQALRVRGEAKLEYVRKGKRENCKITSK